MKKILLVAINARWTHSNPAVYYLKTYIKKINDNVEILELNINLNTLDILSAIHNKKPDILAFSVYIWNSNIIKYILKEIKKILPNTKIIVGGPEVSYNADYWLNEFPSIDHVIIGEGESAISHIIKNNPTSKKIFIKNPPFKEIDFPYEKEDLIALKNKYIYYESSRGCPFRCSYCLSSREDQKTQFRNLNNVIDEIDFIAKYNPKIIKFVDRTFNAKQSHSQAIWKFLIEKNYDIRFHFEIHPGLLEESDFEILSNAKKGYFQFEIGIQSLNEKTLKAVNRTSDWNKSKENIKKLLKQGNIHIHLDLIVGLPYEDLPSFKKSFNGLYELKPHQLQIGFLKVLPGTPIELQKKRFGIINTDFAPYIILSNNWLDFETLTNLHDFEKAFEIFYNSHYSDTTIYELEKYFDTPFELYYDLSQYLKNDNFSSINKVFEFLHTFIKKFKEKEFLEDCLRWDWAKKSKAHFFPEFLNTKELISAKKKGYKFIFENSKFQISKSNLKRAVFFSAKTDRFRKTYQNNNLITVFLNDKNQKINLPFVELR